MPDETCARARKLSEAQEISMAELARSGIENVLSVYSPASNKERTRALPRALFRAFFVHGIQDHHARTRRLREAARREKKPGESFTEVVSRADVDGGRVTGAALLAYYEAGGSGASGRRDAGECSVDLIVTMASFRRFG